MGGVAGAAELTAGPGYFFLSWGACRVTVSVGPAADSGAHVGRWTAESEGAAVWSGPYRGGLLLASEESKRGRGLGGLTERWGLGFR